MYLSFIDEYYNATHWEGRSRAPTTRHSLRYLYLKIAQLPTGRRIYIQLLNFIETTHVSIELRIPQLHATRN